MRSIGAATSVRQGRMSILPVIEHKGYIGKITGLEGGVLHGRVANIRNVVSFEGKTGKQLERAFRDSVEDYLAMCEEEGLKPQRPFSGTFNLRLPPELHRLAAVQAEREGKSLNSLVVEAVAEKTGAA